MLQYLTPETLTEARTSQHPIARREAAPVPGQDSRQRRLPKSTLNRRDALRRLATVLAEPTVLSLENHRRLQHLHRMPGPGRNHAPEIPRRRIHAEPLYLTERPLPRLRQHLLKNHLRHLPAKKHHTLIRIRMPVNRHHRPRHQRIQHPLTTIPAEVLKSKFCLNRGFTAAFPSSSATRFLSMSIIIINVKVNVNATAQFHNSHQCRHTREAHSTLQPHKSYSQISSSPDSQFGNGGFFDSSPYIIAILFLKSIAFLTTSSFRQSNKGRFSGIGISRPKP